MSRQIPVDSAPQRWTGSFSRLHGLSKVASNLLGSKVSHFKFGVHDGAPACRWDKLPLALAARWHSFAGTWVGTRSLLVVPQLGWMGANQANQAR